jgi:hypothetical protein
VKNANNSLSITFTSVPYATYTLQCSTDLLSWLDINNDIEASAATTTVTGTPGEFFFYDTGEPRRYYRVKANP